jgi:hypothetical protein
MGEYNNDEPRFTIKHDMPKNPVQADEQIFLHKFYLFVRTAKLDKCFLAKELCSKTNHARFSTSKFLHV